MDRSYIIRIYKNKNDVIDGIVEDVEFHKREKFCNSEQLWRLITARYDNGEAKNIFQLRKVNKVTKTDKPG